VEDITSSLYYLHVEQPEDANLVAPPEFQVPDYRNPQPLGLDPPSLSTVPRKAVPGAAVPQRKPLFGTLAPIENYGSRQNMSAGNYSRQSGMLAPNLDPRQSLESSRYQTENMRPVLPSNRSPERARPMGTSLTLIRRDPASGAQWNVARIEDPPITEISSLTLNESAVKKKIGAPMYIDVTNPGYSKFLQSENADRPPLPSRPGDASARPNQTVTSSHPCVSETPTDSSNTFRRRLWMEGSQYASGGFGHRKNNSHDFNSGRPDSRGSYDGSRDGYSFDNRPAASPSFLTRDDQTFSTIQVSDRPTSFRGYVFTSPWDGRCEFATSAGGGTLKVGVNAGLPLAQANKLAVSTYHSWSARSTASSHARQRTSIQLAK
jgi:hypothetical protein